MKAVLISIQPKWCELIASGKKTIEVRKTRPSIETPFKCYIYMTATKERCRLWGYITAYQNSNGDILNGSKKVIGEFVCDGIYNIEPHDDGHGVNQYTFVGADYDDCKTGLSFEELKEYLGEECGYAWHVTDLKIYDKPKELGEFYTLGNCEKYDFCNQCKNFHRGQGWLDGSYCDEDSCLDNTRIPVTRAPQSWCYVEELL